MRTIPLIEQKGGVGKSKLSPSSPGILRLTRLGVTATRESLRKSRRPRVGPATLRLIRRATVRLPGLVSLALV
jgi:hypothetical protein